MNSADFVLKLIVQKKILEKVDSAWALSCATGKVTEKSWILQTPSQVILLLFLVLEMMPHTHETVPVTKKIQSLLNILSHQ